MSKKKNQYSFDFVDVFAFFFKWRKHLLIVSVVTAIISGVISSPIFITPLYKSTALFFPSTTNSISSTLFYTIKEKAKDPLKFGDEEVDEQYMQILESGYLKSNVINHFNLMEHYKIDSSRGDKFTALYRKYEENIKARRTNYNSIEISVYDIEPKMSSDIANYILLMVDTVKKQIQAPVANQIFTIIEEQYQKKQAYVDTLKYRMKMLGVKGVYLGIKGVYGSSQSKGSDQSGASKSNINESGAEYVALEEELTFEVEQLTNLKLKYDQAKVDLDAKLSNIFVVNYASPSEGKAYPIRSIIVLLSVISTFVMACVVIVFIEKYNQFKKNLGSN
jgi:uncharacterized protein involved in exopolysaccharide biosynthesis